MLGLACQLLNEAERTCVCGYKKAAFSPGWWEEAEPSHRRRVAAREMMSLTVQGPSTTLTLPSLFKRTPTIITHTRLHARAQQAPLAQTLTASEFRDTTRAR